MLLGLQEGRDETKQQMEWTEIETNVRLYPQEGTPFDEPWDVTEDNKSIKEFHMDDYVAQDEKHLQQGVMMSPINRYILKIIMPSSNLKAVTFSH